MVLDMPVIRRSTMVIAAMDSTTTTALGTMTGSLPAGDRDGGFLAFSGYRLLRL